VEISNTARSAGWIKTQYNNQNSPTTFISTSSEEKVTSFYESILMLSIPDATTGYKWQVKACDDDYDCSAWASYSTSTPNFKVDTISPTAPGALTEDTKTSNTITLNYGASTTETNFTNYRIFYSAVSPITELSTEKIDSNLNYINYNGQSTITFEELMPNTPYYFNIWAYDVVGHSASSTEMNVTTGQVVSSPGATFYSKGTSGTSTLYYRIWDGLNWGAEQIGPNFGTSTIRHVRSIRSDDKGRIAVVGKIWENNKQQIWATVYNFAANTFASTTRLGETIIGNGDNNNMNVCLGVLSGKEFIALKYNDPERTLSITNCGRNTPTTKERLNGIKGVYICTKNGQMYLNGEQWDGSLIDVK
jgi:hypothetical protein